MGSVITMYGAFTGGAQDSLVSQDVPMSCNLIGVVWAVTMDLDADAESWIGQLAFGPTMIATTDSRSVIDTVVASTYLLTSGYGIPSINVYRPMPDIQLMGGERLFINVLSTAGVVGTVRAHLHFDIDIAKPSRRRV